MAESKENAVGENVAILSIHLGETGLITVCLFGNPRAAADARLIILERADKAELQGPDCLTVPWWQFAPILPHVGSLTQAYPGLKVQIDEQTADLLRRAREAGRGYANATEIQPVEPAALESALRSAGFARSLTENQVRNVCRLAAIPNGATFSVPGSGKTTEALALYCFRTELQRRLLVVAPKNAFAAWDEQVSACLAALTVTRLTGGREGVQAALERQPQIAIITYSQLVNVTDIVAAYLARHRSIMFLDESHKIKGGEHRAWAGAVLSVSHLPEWKLIMSGTPMPNTPEDLLPQLRFLYPTLPPDIDPIGAIQPIYVRTTKAELNLPPIEAFATPIAMSEPQARLYRLCAAEVARDAEEALNSGDRLLLRKLGRHYILLLQLVSNPALLAQYYGSFDDELLAAAVQSDSPKLAYVCYRARQLAGANNKVLIWSGFVQNVEIIAGRLADLGADYIHGGVEAGSEEEEDTREAKVARFHNDPNAQVLVANPAAASEGISLHTVCHHAIYLDRNYNAAQYLQSADRIHRLGLQLDITTHIEFVYSPGTIDESVRRRLDFKIARMENALNDRSISVPTHWRDDLEELPDEADIRDLLQTLQRDEV